MLWAALLLGLLWGGSVLYVHRRGRVRHGIFRVLADHSTYAAPFNILLYACSAVPRRPYLDVADFPHLAPLRDNWELIRDEVLALHDAGAIRPAEQYDDIAFNTFFKRGWKRFYLKWYGAPLPSARALCPRTTALVESIPEVNAALFALLPPGGKLGAHRDPFAGSLRYHLGLVTPNSDACRILVDGEPYAWRDGEAVVFDETFIHEAVNRTDTTRIILFCDVARPLHTPVARALSRVLTRWVVPITAARNTPDEALGALNHVARPLYVGREFFARLKKKNRRVYYAVKYGAIASVLVALLAALV